MNHMTPSSNFDEVILLLETQRRQILETLDGLSVSLRPIELDQSVQGRLSRMDAINQQQVAKSSQSHLRLELSRVDAALARHHAGRFGLCCQCHMPVEAERIRAEPATPFCLTCLEDIAAAKRTRTPP